MALDRFRAWARALKRDAITVYFVARHPATSRWTRLLALAVAAYALSPIDLIPDFIPLLGYLDDLLLVPLGLWLVLRRVPATVLDECRARADAVAQKPVSRAGALVIVVLWIAVLACIGVAAWRAMSARG